MAVDRHNLWSSLDLCLCGEQPIPVSTELKLYAYKSCLSDYIHTHTHTHTHTHVHTFLSPYLLQHSLPCHSALLYTKTKPARSRSLLFDMSPCRKWWEHTHTVNSQINSLTHLLSLSQLEKQRLMPLLWYYTSVTNMNRNQNRYSLYSFC